MAKATGPLFSMQASGTVGKTITFDKRGFVRSRVIPANPQTDVQGNVRQKLLAIQKALTYLGAAVIFAVKSVAPVSYRWNSFLLKQALGPNNGEFDASRTAFNALTAPERAAWNAAAQDIGIIEQTVLYASDPPVSPGLALFAISRVLYTLGLNSEAGVPAGANHADWGEFYTLAE